MANLVYSDFLNHVWTLPIIFLSIVTVIAEQLKHLRKFMAFDPRKELRTSSNVTTMCSSVTVDVIQRKKLHFSFTAARALSSIFRDDLKLEFEKRAPSISPNLFRELFSPKTGLLVALLTVGLVVLTSSIARLFFMRLSIALAICLNLFTMTQVETVLGSFGCFGECHGKVPWLA